MILAATENLKESEQSQPEMSKKLEETEAASSIAMNKLCLLLNYFLLFAQLLHCY